MTLGSKDIHLQQSRSVSASLLESPCEIVALILPSVEMNHHTLIFPALADASIDSKDLKIPCWRVHQAILDSDRDLVEDRTICHHPVQPVDVIVSLPKSVAPQRRSRPRFLQLPDEVQRNIMVHLRASSFNPKVNVALDWMLQGARFSHPFDSTSQIANESSGRDDRLHVLTVVDQRLPFCHSDVLCSSSSQRHPHLAISLKIFSSELGPQSVRCPRIQKSFSTLLDSSYLDCP